MPLCAEFIEYFINHCKLGRLGGQKYEEKIIYIMFIVRNVSYFWWLQYSKFNS